MNKHILLSSLVILLFLVNSINASDKAKIDEAAPNFKLSDSNGKEHSLSDFKGKYVVLEWINFECPFVKKHYESKNMQNLQKQFTDKGVVWLSICSSAEGKQGNYSKEDINKRIKGLEANMSAYLIDESGTVGKMYSAKTTPHMYVINKEGILIYAGGIDDIASTDKADIKKASNFVELALDAAMTGKSVNQKVSKPYGCSIKYQN